MIDEITQAVFARDEVAKYIGGSHGLRGDEARARVEGYLDELRTTQRHKFYRALQHPLYPILRKIERKHENLHYVTNAVRSHRIVYASNHKSHTDYLVEPLVLDDNGIRDLWRQHTGHGIGLRNHEAPFLDVGDHTPLQPGMVFTIEPGVYKEGLGGFRHSDTVLLTGTGLEILTDYPHDLASLTILG